MTPASPTSLSRNALRQEQRRLAAERQTRVQHATPSSPTQALSDLQSQLIGQIIFAQENHDALQDALTNPALAKLDWEQMVFASAQSHAPTHTLIQNIRQVLGVLKKPQQTHALPVGYADGTLALAVAHVPDGDGLELTDGTRVRYAGIDAPEMDGLGDRPELLAEEALALNQRLVSGRVVHLIKDTTEADRYGRLLRYVYVGDVLVNAELLRAGLAMAFTIHPDERHVTEFLQLEREARSRKLGMWSRGYV
jgi:micrococcal nuclease